MGDKQREDNLIRLKRKRSGTPGLKGESPEYDDAYYDELIKQRIGEALRNQEKEEKLDLEVLRSWVAEDRRKRRSRRNRYLAVACCLLILFTGIFGVNSLLHREDYYATAGKNDPQVNKSDNSVVIKNNGEDVEANIGTEEVVITNWDQIASVEKTYPDLLIPSYVPDGFEFQELQIESTALGNIYAYYFNKGESTLCFTQSTNVDMQVIKNYNRVLKTESGEEIYIKEDMEKNGFYSYAENELCKIIGSLSDEEYIKIVEGLETVKG